jgi:hypothetical protein
MSTLVEAVDPAQVSPEYDNLIAEMGRLRKSWVANIINEKSGSCTLFNGWTIQMVKTSQKNLLKI